MSKPQYWYCLVHHTVEPRHGCKNADRLGPFETESDAAGALERVQQRNEEWDAASKKDDWED